MILQNRRRAGCIYWSIQGIVNRVMFAASRNNTKKEDRSHNYRNGKC